MPSEILIYDEWEQNYSQELPIFGSMVFQEKCPENTVNLEIKNPNNFRTTQGFFMIQTDL